MSAGERGRCRSCGAQVLWAHTQAGKRIPLDAEPIKGAFHVAKSETLFGQPLGLYVVHATDVHLSHFVTCPDAAQWRKSGRPAEEAVGGAPADG